MITSKLKSAAFVGNPNYLTKLLGKYSSCADDSYSFKLDMELQHLGIINSDNPKMSRLDNSDIPPVYCALLLYSI